MSFVSWCFIKLCWLPGSFIDYRPIFEDARRKGLNITIHTAEVETAVEETDAIIDFCPDRLGHAAILTDEQITNILRKKIPIEVCLSSNLTTLAVAKLEEHPVGIWLRNKHPFCLCTDDISLFGSEVSDEWELLQKTFHLSDENVKELVTQSRALHF